jgi:hypothetical protein
MNALLDGQKTSKEDKPMYIPPFSDRKAAPFNLTFNAQMFVKQADQNGRRGRLVFFGASGNQTNELKELAAANSNLKIARNENQFATALTEKLKSVQPKSSKPASRCV